MEWNGWKDCGNQTSVSNKRFNPHKVKTQITRKTQLKISALSKNVRDTYFYGVRNWYRGSQFQNEVISHATQKKRKNSHDRIEGQKNGRK